RRIKSIQKQRKETEQQESIQETEKIEIPMLENPKKKRKTRTVNETRTGCKAMIRFKQDKPTSDFLVVAHELQHNHDLVIEEERHHLKSERNITDETGQLIESMVDCGIKPMDAYNFLCNEAGAEEILRDGEALKPVTTSEIE
ncbi:Protein FAR1-RELATED SEQUENCE 5, partial [Bienertia sinuspersici]